MFKLRLEQKKVWHQLAEGALSDDFARSASAFALVYGEDLERIYRSAVYYLPEQGKDTLEQIERELSAAQEALATELERLGTRPPSRKYKERDDGERIYEGSPSHNGIFSVAHAFSFVGCEWMQDDSAGETWDKENEQIQQTHSPSIDVLEKKKQSLNSALDSMYLSS